MFSSPVMAGRLFSRRLFSAEETDRSQKTFGSDSTPRHTDGWTQHKDDSTNDGVKIWCYERQSFCLRGGGGSRASINLRASSGSLWCYVVWHHCQLVAIFKYCMTTEGQFNSQPISYIYLCGCRCTSKNKIVLILNKMSCFPDFAAFTQNINLRPLHSSLIYILMRRKLPLTPTRVA